MVRERKKFSRISVLHTCKLCVRSAMLLGAIALYIVLRVSGKPFENFRVQIKTPFAIWSLVAFGLLFCDMLSRFFPSPFESMGCQKQFKRNHVPTGEETPKRQAAWRTFAVAAFWVVLNGGIAALYYTHVIDGGVLVLVSLLYSVCDMICILFFCPFQTWVMKNKCCGTCRIYNWDFAMIVTPLIFLFDPVSWVMTTLAAVLLAEWEILYHVYPERFTENTNESLACANCKEKLCQHKKQLRGFLKKLRSEIKNK